MPNKTPDAVVAALLAVAEAKAALWEQRFNTLIRGHTSIEGLVGNNDGTWVIRFPRRNGHSIIDDVDDKIAKDAKRPANPKRPA